MYKLLVNLNPSLSSLSFVCSLFHHELLPFLFFWPFTFSEVLDIKLHKKNVSFTRPHTMFVLFPFSHISPLSMPSSQLAIAESKEMGVNGSQVR
jgi:hypothetical protein